MAANATEVASGAAEIGLPVVVKPVMGSGSSGVKMCDRRYSWDGRSWDGKQIIPAPDIRRGEKHLANDAPTRSSDYSYRSQGWISDDKFGAVEARVIHGQRLYIALGTEIVVALWIAAGRFGCVHGSDHHATDASARMSTVRLA